jgi:pimeloyl-ACP methyl ester carboxylesterase
MFDGFELTSFEHRAGGLDTTFDDLATRAAALLPEGQRSFVCGESFGGPIALLIARRYPERVAGLILLATFGRLPRAARLHARVGLAIWARLIDHAPALAVGARAIGMPSQFGRRVPLSTIRTYLREPLMTGAEYQHKVRLIAGFDARPWLSEIRCPSIVILGSRDPVVPLKAGRELAALLSDVRLHELPCGHLGYLALPSDIRRCVEEWRASIARQSTLLRDGDPPLPHPPPRRGMSQTTLR